MTIQDVVSQWNTTPFLFVGSGMTRRYLNLPDWKGLLLHFTTRISSDAFKYNAYVSKAEKEEPLQGVMPKIAELIQHDFDDLWFSNPEMRQLNEDELEFVRQGVSPFKVEIASYIKKHAVINEAHRNEINKLSEISERSISGIITTNYDSFLEDTFQGYTKYIGQNELIFSAVQGIAEIYKIHGSIEKPSSIVINEADYIAFDEKSSYLAAKLMTIFMEYPIVFMGYSISDSNVQKIIESIVACLDNEQLKKLEDRFIFVDYNPEQKTPEVSAMMIRVGSKALNMRRIQLSDFMPLYNAISGKKSKLPVRILRRFKQEFYEFTITHEPTGRIRVGSIDDSRIADEDLILSIGKAADMGLVGLSSIDANDWYRNLLLEDIDFTADELLEYSFPKLLRLSSNRLPIHKYLKQAKKAHPECSIYAQTRTFKEIISQSIKNNRQCLGNYKSVHEIWHAEKNNVEKATRLLSHLPEEQIVLEELEAVLTEMFENDANILNTASSATRTNIRRLIMIYDYLKWGK